MRKLFVALTVIAVMAMSVMPSLAQDEGTIVDIAVEDGRFTTLVAAVQAAGLVDTLNSEGPFTVFAPTDDAFAALPEGTVEALLEDTDALTDILLYHVVEGEVFAETVVALDSATTVLGEDVTITVDADGNVFLNDTVQVIITDIQASNGVIHVIDTVLLPPTEEPTTHIRVAHFSSDTPAVDVYINGELSAVQGLEFPTITDWLEVPAGTYNVTVAPAGTDIDSAAIGPADLTFEADQWYTVAARGSLADGTLAPSIIAEDFSDLAPANARVTIFHAIEDAPAVDVYLADGTQLVSQLAYPGNLGENDGVFELEVPAGTYDLQVTPFGAPDTVLFDLSGTELMANSAYFVAAVGTLANEDAQIALAATDFNAMMENMMDEEEMASDMNEDISEPGTIVDIAVADGRFTTLVAAVTAADLVETLSGEELFTVFAPTDDAFAALPAGTLDAVLADSDILNSVLLYHVIEGEVYAADVSNLDSATTVGGSDITIEVDEDGNVILNGAIMVVITDIQASNGVIHVIDGVLVP